MSDDFSFSKVVDVLAKLTDADKTKLFNSFTKTAIDSFAHGSEKDVHIRKDSIQYAFKWYGGALVIYYWIWAILAILFMFICCRTLGKTGGRSGGGDKRSKKSA